MTLKKILKLLVLYLTAFLLRESNANIIKVPVDQPTIQAAIDIVSSGDTILVAIGRYYENIKLENKNMESLGYRM